MRSEGTLLSDHIEREARAFQAAWDRAHSHDVYIAQVRIHADRR